jgi:hypothetical protein
MNYKQYRKALEQLELSQVAAGVMFDVGPRTARRWALGEARIPAAVSMLLKLMVDRRLELSVPVVNEEIGRADIDPTYRHWTLKAFTKLE